MHRVDPHPHGFLAEFHHWYLDRPAASGENRTVVIENLPGRGNLTTLCDRLNLCLDGRGTRWLGFGAGEIDRIAADPASLALLGIVACPNCPPEGPCGRRKIIRALADRGEAVITDPHAATTLLNRTGVLRLRFDPRAGLVTLAGDQPSDLPTFLADLAADYLEAGWRESARYRANRAQHPPAAPTNMPTFPHGSAS